MDVGRSLSFIFQDRGWIGKLLVFVVLMIIPIIGWLFLAGYLLQLLGNVIRGEDDPLPEWTNWGELLAGGFKTFVVGIVWAIPSLIIQAISDASSSFLISVIAFVVGLLISAVTWSAYGDLAVTGNIADGLSRRPFDRVIDNLNTWALLVVFEFVLSIIALVGLIGILIGVLFTFAIAFWAITHLAGQAYRASEGQSAVITRRF